MLSRVVRTISTQHHKQTKKNDHSKFSPPSVSNLYFYFRLIANAMQRNVRHYRFLLQHKMQQTRAFYIFRMNRRAHNCTYECRQHHTLPHSHFTREHRIQWYRCVGDHSIWLLLMERILLHRIFFSYFIVLHFVCSVWHRKTNRNLFDAYIDDTNSQQTHTHSGRTA